MLGGSQSNLYLSLIGRIESVESRWRMCTTYCRERRRLSAREFGPRAGIGKSKRLGSHRLSSNSYVLVLDERWLFLSFPALSGSPPSSVRWVAALSPTSRPFNHSTPFGLLKHWRSCLSEQSTLRVFGWICGNHQN